MNIRQKEQFLKRIKDKWGIDNPYLYQIAELSSLTYNFGELYNAVTLKPERVAARIYACNYKNKVAYYEVEHPYYIEDIQYHPSDGMRDLLSRFMPGMENDIDFLYYSFESQPYTENVVYITSFWWIDNQKNVMRLTMPVSINLIEDSYVNGFELMQKEKQYFELHPEKVG